MRGGLMDDINMELYDSYILCLNSGSRIFLQNSI